MINPISSAHPADAQQTAPPPPPKPAPEAQTPKSGELSSDKVTLKSAGQVDHDGDSK